MANLGARPVRNVALAALPLAAVLVAGVVVLNENQRWAAWGERFALHQVNVAEADYRRPPLVGDGQCGNAFDDYARAVALSDSILSNPSAVVAGLWLLPQERLLEPEAELRLAEWRPALELVRSGARRSYAELPAAWFDPAADAVRFGAWRQLTYGAVLEARRLVLLGESRAALEIVLDSTSLLLDVGRSPVLSHSLVAANLLQIPLRDGLSPELVAGLDGLSVQTLLTALDRIDAALLAEYPLVLHQARYFENVDEYASDPLFRTFHRWRQRKALDAGYFAPDRRPPDPQHLTNLRIRVHTLRAAVRKSLEQRVLGSDPLGHGQ